MIWKLGKNRFKEVIVLKIHIKIEIRAREGKYLYRIHTFIIRIVASEL